MALLSILLAINTKKNPHCCVEVGGFLTLAKRDVIKCINRLSRVRYDVKI